jgi:hypothetical protein
MLKCPKCPRTEFLSKFGVKNWRNESLNLEHLKTFLDIDLTGKNFLLCGNYGDPIYYSNLILMVQWIKEQSATIHLVTNGSYKSSKWWQELCGLLDENDSIVFSIDGTPENFTQYRKNADWESILNGITVANKSKAVTTWKYIPFSFNEYFIDDIKTYSVELGFDRFLIDPSDRWESETDEFKPKSFIGPREQKIQLFRSSVKNKIDPLCKNENNQHYISANGFYMPCCYVGDHRFYFKSEFYKNKEMYDISKTTITNVLKQTKNFYDTIEQQELTYCSFNCPKI